MMHQILLLMYLQNLHILSTSTFAHQTEIARGARSCARRRAPSTPNKTGGGVELAFVTYAILRNRFGCCAHRRSERERDDREKVKIGELVVSRVGEPGDWGVKGRRSVQKVGGSCKICASGSPEVAERAWKVRKGER